MKRFEKKIYFFIGTEAEFGKLTPIFKELKQRKIDFKIIDSGQNIINYADFKKYVGNLAPSIQLTQKANKSSLFIFMIWVVRVFFKGIFSLRKEFEGLDKSNCYFVIHGDTVTSTMGAFIAKFYRLKLAHVEAGYFSHNYLEPFPEEICKHINSYLADVMFAPSNWNLKNLKSFNGEKINTTYNTNIDSFWWAMHQKGALPKFLKKKNFFLLIIHRQEHVMFKKEWTKKVMQFVIENAPKSLTCVLLNHPLTIEIINQLDLKKKKIMVIDPLQYIDFLKLFKKSEFIATDSATNQQEAFYLGKPYLGLADYSVQTEGMGRNAVLAKSDPVIMKEFLINYKKYTRPLVTSKKSPAKIVVDYLVAH